MMINDLRIKTAHNLSQFLLKHPFIGAGGIKRTLVKILIPVPCGSTNIQTRFGFNIIVNPVLDKIIERSIYYYGTYEFGTLYVLSKCLRKGDSFMDVGSNIGFISLYASGLVGGNGIVYSFEPFSETFSILKKNIELNRIKNIHIYNEAIGSKRGVAKIYSNLNGNRGGATMMEIKNSKLSGTDVNVQALDQFVSSNRILKICLLKVDVEGWELKVLKGGNRLLSTTDAPIICIEYSERHPIQNDKLVGIYNFLLNINKYKIYKLKKGKNVISKLIEVKNYKNLPHHDNLFCFLPTHLNYVDSDIFL